jgi:hypothetical protein
MGRITLPTHRPLSIDWCGLQMVVSLRHGKIYVRSTAFLALVACGLAAGCGGSSDPQATRSSDSQASTQRTVELSKAEFVDRASTICETAQEHSTEEFGKYVQDNRVPSSGPGVAAKAADAFRIVFRPAIEEEIEGLGELEPPKDDQKQVNAILAAMRQGLKKAEEDPLEFIQTSSALVHASRLAASYGLPACSPNSG